MRKAIISILGLAFLGPLTPAANAQLASIPCSIEGVEQLLGNRQIEIIFPHDDAVGVVENAPAGTLFCFQPGIHRLRTRLVPERGDAFVGVPGAVLNGSAVIAEFARSGNHWVIGGQTQEWYTGGRCMDPVDPNYQGCIYPEDVYLDDVPLWQVTSRDALAPGRFFFDYPNDRVFLADDPRGREVEITVVIQAISADYLVEPAKDVVIRGLIIEKFGNAYQTGAIHSGENWLIEHNEIRLNHAIGVCADTRSWLRNNYIHHNGEMGICGQGADIRVTDNEIAFNNTQGFDWWENGGSKWVFTSNLLVARNYSHHNIGPGLWTDIDNIDTTYKENIVSDNVGPGILHEISYRASIEDNTVVRNGFGYLAWVPAGILVVSSRDVTITGNRLRANKGGIGLTQDDRVSGTLGPRSMQNITIDDNDIRFSRGAAGYWSFWGARPRWTPKGVTFTNNRYENIPKKPFRWGQPVYGVKGWRGLGFDLDSHFG